jgi:hypothetical protein
MMNGVAEEAASVPSTKSSWQSDFMHCRLADGSDVEVLNWLHDHSRFLLGATAHQPVTGDVVVARS